MVSRGCFDLTGENCVSYDGNSITVTAANVGDPYPGSGVEEYVVDVQSMGYSLPTGSITLCMGPCSTGTIECGTAIGKLDAGSCGPDKIDFNCPVNFWCDVEIGDFANQCVGGEELMVYDPATFMCTTQFTDDVIIGSAGGGPCDDTFTVYSGTDFYCGVHIDSVCEFDVNGDHINPLDVDAPAEFSCNTYIGQSTRANAAVIGSFTQDVVTCAGTTALTMWDRATDLDRVDTGNNGAHPSFFEVYYPAHFEADVSIGDKQNVTNLYIEAKSFIHDDFKICSAAELYAGGDVTFGDDNDICSAYTFEVWNQSTFNCVVTLDGKDQPEPNVSCGEARGMRPILLAKDDVKFECDLYIKKSLYVDENLEVLGNTTLGNDCDNDTLTVVSTSFFNCNVTIGEVACDKDLTVNSDATFNCPVTFTQCVEAGDLKVTGELSTAGSFYICGEGPSCGDGGGIIFPCPTGGDQILLSDGTSLNWTNYVIETISVCDPVTGQTTPYNILTIP
jgi:hypothetical protein